MVEEEEEGEVDVVVVVCVLLESQALAMVAVVGVAGKPKPAKFGVNEPSLLTSFDAKQSDDDPSVSIHSCCKRYIGKELST